MRRITQWRATIGGAAVVLGIASASCRKDGGEEGDAAVQAVVSVQTAVVTPQAFTETMSAIGDVVPRAGHVATLSAPSAGRVGQVFVTTGQAVRAGQPLVELDQAPYHIATQAADAALAAAQQASARQQRLADEGILPRKDAEQAAADVAKARADAAGAHRSEELSVLKSPIAGVITRMSATLGASVDPAEPLIEVADPRAVDVLLSVTPTEAGRLRPGMKVSLSAGQSATGEPLGVGTLTDIAGTVDTATRGVAVRVQAPATRRPLRIGETVFGQIAVATIPRAIVVPADAVVPEGEQFKVFVVDSAGVAHAREVTVGGKSNGQAEILSGLRAGERVVTYGAYGMQDSAKVAPLTPVPAKPAGPDTAGASKRGTP